MNNTLYVGLSRQMTLQREMDLIANNIANSDTAGFKVESLMLREDPERPAAKAGGGLQPDKIIFVQDAGVARDFAQGSLHQTGATFDLGLQGDGFFQVNTPQGPRFTRDGRFSLDAQGQIVNPAGDALLSANGQPIVIDPTKTAPVIASDGSISQEGTLLGKVGVFGFANLGGLQKVGNGLFDAAGQAPVPAAATKVEQGMIETSNADPVQQMTRLISVSRTYERIAGMMDQTGNTSDQSIQRLGRVN